MGALLCTADRLVCYGARAKASSRDRSYWLQRPHPVWAVAMT